LREEGGSGIGMKSLSNFLDVLDSVTGRNGLTWVDPEKMPEAGC